jgi:hypothetical protein
MTEKIDYDPAWLEIYPHEPYAHADTRWPVLVEPAGEHIKRILDIGGANGVMAMGYWYGRGAAVHVLDLWEPATPLPNFTRGNALDAIRIYGQKAFDVVQMTEVLEHMKKDVGYYMLDVILPALARKMVLVTTPCGYSVQEQEVGGNPHQRHISGWSPAELADRGYQVLINGPERTGRWREVEQQHDRPQLIGWRIL